MPREIVCYLPHTGGNSLQSQCFFYFIMYDWDNLEKYRCDSLEDLFRKNMMRIKVLSIILIYGNTISRAV